MASSKVDFEDHGIATIIQRYSLVVPVNQRPYAWEKEHVEELFTDLERAIDNTESEYFLGTMVAIRQGSKVLDVADGQQRLATTVILIAAIRDHLSSDPSQTKYVQHLETNYLKSYDPDSDRDLPKLALNVEDNDVYIQSIIESPASPARKPFATNLPASHRLLQAATLLAKERVAKIVDTPHQTDQIARLKKWITFLADAAKMILVIVPDPSKAFTIFETLNDRGLKLSQVHLLKNYLYGLAETGQRMREAQRRWDAMYGALESIGDDDIFIDYVRQMWISYHGHVKVEKLFDEVKRKKRTPSDAVEFAGQLSDNVTPFTALLNPSHTYWSESFPCRQCIAILNDSLRVDRIRPLMLSIAVTMKMKKPREVEKAFGLCVSWAVRFMIVGGIGSGTVEEFYAETAKKVRDGEITDAASLARIMRERAPSDDKFREFFTIATVSRGAAARYYLRVLESQLKGEKDPHLAADENPENFDLEHVLPQKLSDEWTINEEDCKRLCKRIGNLCILEKKLNSTLKSSGPAIKLPTYASSVRLLTKEIAKESAWGETEIIARQARLAALAVKAWPLKV